MAKFRDHTGRESPFFIVGHSILESSQLSPIARLVFVVLRSFADQDGICYPTRKAICARAGLKEPDTVTRAIRELEAAGVIRAERQHRHSNVFHTGWTVPNLGRLNRPKKKDLSRLNRPKGGVLSRFNRPNMPVKPAQLGRLNRLQLDSVELDSRTRRDEFEFLTSENEGNGGGLKALIERAKDRGEVRRPLLKAHEKPKAEKE